MEKYNYYDKGNVRIPRQLEWKVVGMLDLLGLWGVWKKKITTI